MLAMFDVAEGAGN